MARLVISGSVRDSEAIIASKFPVFCEGLCVRGTSKINQGNLNIPITITNTKIYPGDYILGDRDGIVVVPENKVIEVMDAAQKRDQKEATVITQINCGASLWGIYDYSQKTQDLPS